MTWLFASAWLIVLAVALELLLRWPSCVPHPARIIGLFLDMLEVAARRATHKRCAGALCLAVTVALVGFATSWLVSIQHLGVLFSLLLAFAGLALGELLQTCSVALRTLEVDEVSGNFTASREHIGRLVSRNTAVMDAPELRRALAESLAENFNDAFIAPLFWLLVGGPVGLWIYKTVSTMDSMWGYRTEKWNELGMAGARCDDLLAWIPARLSALLLRLAAPRCMHAGSWPGWSVIKQQAGTMASPNSGWPMAAAAWLHDARMGGPTPYCDEIVHKPVLGPTGNTAPMWDTQRLANLIRHVRVAGLFGALIAVGLAVIF